jgi:NAD(P)H-hydrate epimerase
MVFLATPQEDKNISQKEQLFSKLRSVVWIPREDLDRYIDKSDAILIGPGLMRFQKEGEMENNGVLDQAGTETKMLTKYLLQKFPNKKWVIDGGSLQVMEASWIPKGAIVTPNKKEFELLTTSPPAPLLSKERGAEGGVRSVEDFAKKYECVVVSKGSVSYVSDGETTYEVGGGNAGLTKGGTGDVLAGVIVGLAAKNPPLLAAAAGSYLVKKTAEVLSEKVGLNFNADDVSEQVFQTWKSLSSHS